MEHRDAAADFVYTGTKPIPFALPGTLKVILDAAAWQSQLMTRNDAEENRLLRRNVFPSLKQPLTPKQLSKRGTELCYAGWQCAG
jgi:hypothetical protein